MIFKGCSIFLIYFYLFILYLSSATNKKSKYLQDELKGKSNFVQQKLSLNGSNPRQKTKRKKEKEKRIKINPTMCVHTKS